jgi:hypothetical protein
VEETTTDVRDEVAERLDELARRSWAIDESTAGLVRDLGDEANSPLREFLDDVDDETVWRLLQRLREHAH